MSVFTSEVGATITIIPGDRYYLVRVAHKEITLPGRRNRETGERAGDVDFFVPKDLGDALIEALERRQPKSG